MRVKFGQFKACACIIIGTFVLSGCQTAQPQSPMEAYLNRAAGAEIVVQQCPAYGGYDSVASMREDAKKNTVKAKALGATEADLKAARSRVNGNFTTAVIFVGIPSACNAFLSQLAWVGSEDVTMDGQVKK